MAATKRNTTKPVEVEEVDQVEPDEPVADESESVEPEQVTEPEEGLVAESTPAVGYLWVTRKRPVQLMGNNPQWEKPVEIDAKSFPELELQGWRVADGPDATGPSK